MIWINDDDKAETPGLCRVECWPTCRGWFADASVRDHRRGQSGKVLKKWEGLTHALVGTGPGGNAKTGQYNWGSGGKYGFLDVTQSGTTCTMNNTNVKTVNLKDGSTGSSTTAFSYTCPRNTVKTINGAYSPLNDAHYFGGIMPDILHRYTGSKALTFQLIMRTHYGSSYENAFWNGTNMSFGDGASTFYPLVSIDVAGHEVSHGYTEQQSNLSLLRPVRRHERGVSRTWAAKPPSTTGRARTTGRSARTSSRPPGALRYMNNPPQDGASIDNASKYTSSMDVHYSFGRLQQGVLPAGDEVGLEHAEGLPGLRARQQALLNGRRAAPSTRVPAACRRRLPTSASPRRM